jgi:curved DNA-binding protein CbpA
MGRNREGMYLWMCLPHVRDYNKNFNYFSGLDDDAIAKFQKDTITGARPTWQMGTNSTSKHPPLNERNPNAEGAQRLYNRTNYAANARAGKLASSRTRKLKTLEKKSFEDLNLPFTATGEEIKARYKLLVKQNHPDANGGDRSSEERLREIILAYKILQKAGFC